MPSLFNTPLDRLRGIGASRIKLYNRLGVNSIGDLLRFYPRTYEDWSHPRKIADAPENEACCIRAVIERVSKPARIHGNLTIFKFAASDGCDNITITFFNQRYTYQKLLDGGEFLFYGTVKKYSGYYEMSSPTVSDTNGEGIHPVYPATTGLTSKQIETAVRQATALLPERVNDPIPAEILEEYGLCSLDFAIRKIHFPDDFEDVGRARQRLAFEEMLILQLGMARLKRGGTREKTPYITDRDYSNEFQRLLPFRLTAAQNRAIAQCIADMKESVYPMNRLIQGDVGSGKTAVAASVCYTAIKNGMQCAFMAPTEILATQHYKSLSELLADSGIRLALLTGSVTASKKRVIYEALESGEIDLVIGTHALISDSVVFRSLGLVITDEQHRFGVKQRAALISKGANPHIMVMSATPIPRTLALMIFGDLDLSVLDEMPPGRQKVDTCLIDSGKRNRAYNFLKKHIDSGNRCYIVCPLVEENESELESAEAYIKKLEKTVLGEYNIGLLHGKMKASDKDAVMRAFAEGKTDILVSTTVIEVGVNVPEATVMMIENADRFGLSQLHQLRGRVGRGKNKSFCILVSDNQSGNTRERLSVLCRTNDGFKIADEDLRLRGPGDFFGSRQHGLPELKVASMSSVDMIDKTQAAARKILEKDPDLRLKEHRGLYFEISRLFAKVGNTEQLQ